MKVARNSAYPLQGNNNRFVVHSLQYEASGAIVPLGLSFVACFHTGCLVFIIESVT